MPARLLVLALALLAVLPAPASAQFSTLEPGFAEQQVTGDFFLPVGFAPAPDGRVFVVQKLGELQVWDGGQKKLVRDFSSEVNSYSDRGMLGVAVDRDFATNQYVYVLYTREVPGTTTPDDDAPTHSRLERLKVDANNAVVQRTPILGTFTPATVPASGGALAKAPCPAASNTIDCIPADHGWHSIGTIRVDPVDGTLWVGSGDGHGHEVDGTSYRPYDEASFSGKVLHIDRDGRGLSGHPFCPGENDLTKVCTKLYAKGFRNPFRFTVRPGGKGLVLGDVGYSQREELDLVKPGRNYGWPCYEGNERTELYDTTPTCTALYAKEGTADAATPPVWDYAHAQGAAVVGGPELTTGNYPASWAGDVLVGDYVQGWLKRLDVDGADEVTAVHELASGGSGAVDLQQLGSGHLAYLDLGFPSDEPQVRRFVYTPANNAPTARLTASTTSGSAPLTVTFDGRTSTDPDGDPLSYAWDFDDGTTSTSATPTRTFSTNGDYEVVLTVSDGRGQSATARTTIRVGADGPPVPTIDAPADEALYRNGQQVTLQGSAVDPEEGPLSGSRLRWTVTLDHAGHTHIASTQPTDTGATVTFRPETDHDVDSFYRVRLTATDAAGKSASTEIELRPEARQLTLDSTPRGAPLRWNGQPVSTPTTRLTAIGYKPTVEAAASFVKDGVTYEFAGWSDGGERSHTATVPASDSSLVARYTRAGVRTLRLTPTGDTYVDQSLPSLDFGDGLALLVDAVPLQRSLLRFALGSIGEDTVVGARLRLFARDGSGFGGDVRVLPDETSWSEDTTTWPGPPVAGTPVAGSFGPVTYDRWHETALSPLVLGGDGELELAITSGLDDGTAWGSRESAQPPELVLEVATAPSTAIDAGPSGLIADGTPTWTFSGAPAYECRVDGGPWTACTSPWTPSLADGDHVVAVRGTTPAGGVDATPATRSVSIDTDPPGTSITGGPVGETTEPSPVFVFSGSSGTVGFDCRLDAGAWAPCTSPWSPGRLGAGAHVAQVRARDAAGNQDPEPAERRFTVVGGQAAPPRPPAPPSPSPPDTRRPTITVALSARRPVRVRRRSPTRWTASYRLLFDEPVTGTLTLRTTSGVLLGRAAIRAEAYRTAVPAVRLTKAARRRLRRSVTARAVLVVRDRAGNARAVSWRTVLRPPRATPARRRSG